MAKGTPILAPTAANFLVVAAALVGPKIVSVEVFVEQAEHGVAVGI